MKKIFFLFLTCLLFTGCKNLKTKTDTRDIVLEDHLDKPFNCKQNNNGKYKVCFELKGNGGLEPDRAKSLVIIDQEKKQIVFTDKLLIEDVSWIDDNQLKVLTKSGYPHVNQKESGYIYHVVSNKKLDLGYEER